MILLALHIPDGFLSVSMAAIGWGVAVPAVALALYKSRDFDDRFIPLAGLLAAFVFVAQTLQFPIPGGTSAHLVGASLVTILLGPSMGMVVLTSVLLLEAVVFGTGGLLALGWNTVNMVVVMGLVGVSVYHALRRGGAGISVAAFCSGWLATAFGSLVTCMELAAAGITPLLVSLPPMMSTQSVVGVGEGLVTAVAASMIARSRPDLLDEASPGVAGGGLIVALAVLLCALLPPSLYGLAAQTSPWLRFPALVVSLLLCALWILMLLATKIVYRRQKVAIGDSDSV